MEEKMLIVDETTPISSDELISDLKARDLDTIYAAESGGKSVYPFTSKGIDPALYHQWLSMMQRGGKHSKARAARAKARINKRKSKR